jgi:hypothetical protein
MKPLVIDRAIWAPGNHRSYGSSVLWYSDYASGCCLGLLGLSLGATREQLNYRAMPCSVPSVEWPQCLIFCFANGSTVIAAMIASLNDYREIDDWTRESWIRDAFAHWLDRAVEYTGEYRDGPRGEGGELL